MLVAPAHRPLQPQRTALFLAITLALALASVGLGACDTSPGPRAVVASPGSLVEPDQVRKVADLGPGQPDARATQLAAATTRAAATTALVARPGTGAAIEDERNTMGVFREVAPATVYVTQKRTFRSYFAPPETVAAGTGTGFIWDARGHIVTNAHVVGDTESRGVAHNASFEVKTFDGEVYPAQLVGIGAEKDIAVLRIDAKGKKLTPIRLPDRTHNLEVGQKTLAIGNPFGLDHTLTTGVVSALGREVRGFGDRLIRDMIQTDASINPGNSGGPLLDSAGQLIGMNTMIYSRSGASAGIGFAVPVATVRRLVPEIIRYGHPRRVGLGIDLVPDHFARQLGVSGVIVRYVHPNSPAAKAGLRSVREDTRTGRAFFDVIVGIEGAPIANYDDLYAALDGRKPGERVQVKILRGRATTTVHIELADLDRLTREIRR